MLFWSAETTQTSSLAKALDSESTEKRVCDQYMLPRRQLRVCGEKLGVWTCPGQHMKAWNTLYPWETLH